MYICHLRQSKEVTDDGLFMSSLISAYETGQALTKYASLVPTCHVHVRKSVHQQQKNGETMLCEQPVIDAEVTLRIFI